MLQVTLAERKAKANGERSSYFCEFDHPSGTVRVWWGFSNLFYEGHTWYGVAGLVAIDGLEESTRLEQQEVGLQLASLPDGDYADEELNADVRGREVIIYKGYINKYDQVIGQLREVKRYKAQYSTVTRGAEGYTYTIYGNPGLVSLQFPTRKLWNLEFQNIRFKDGKDTGFNDLPNLQAKKVQWTEGQRR